MIQSKTKQDSLPLAAKTTLEPIAQACPYVAGPAVQKARALIYHSSGKRYYNVCEGYTALSKIQKRLKSEVDDESRIDGVAIYPNPTQNNLTVELALEKEEVARFEVYDLKGLLLIEKPLNKNKSNLSLDQLSSGLYLYRIKDPSGKVLKKDKLIIQ